MRGKAVTSPHYAKSKSSESEEERSGVTTVSLDYCFLAGDKDVEESSARDHPVLIMYDSKTRAISAIPVLKKGPEKWVVRWVVRKLYGLGYGGVKVVLKSDGEPAITALVRAIAVAISAETPIIQSPAKDNRCN